METFNRQGATDYFRVFKSYYVVWKLSFHILILKFEKSFKSYYVVWKQHIPKKNHSPFSEFKSYYVVWKLFFMLIAFFLFASFKSYYVVWKRYYFYRCPTEKYMFKSYYVVWKHIFPHLSPPIVARLNRTMWYGNFFSISQTVQISFFV